jgi:3-hydroxyacyl-[acyl-carrier-protein] dehydratase
MEDKVVHGLKHTVRFKREVKPGERFDLETEIISGNRGMYKCKGVGYVNGEVACEAEMLLSIPDIFKSYLPKKGDKPNGESI